MLINTKAVIHFLIYGNILIRVIYSSFKVAIDHNFSIKTNKISKTNHSFCM